MEFGNSYTCVNPSQLQTAIVDWHILADDYNKRCDEKAIAAFRNEIKGFLWWKRKVTEAEARYLAYEDWDYGIGHDRCYGMRRELKKLSRLVEAAIDSGSGVVYLSSDHASILYRSW